MISLVERVHNIVDICWNSFSAKIGCGLIPINKEASMQLHFAYVIKNALDLAVYNSDEEVHIELETNIVCNGARKLCDIVIIIKKGQSVQYLPIELKCYKEYAASGNKRGAIDIFCKDIYKDLEVLELYAEQENYSKGILLAMTDMERIVHPVKRKGKYVDYDIAHGTLLSGNVRKITPIGGKDVDLRINGYYKFNWQQCGNFYFVKLKDEMSLEASSILNSAQLAN